MQLFNWIENERLEQLEILMEKQVKLQKEIH